MRFPKLSAGVAALVVTAVLVGCGSSKPPPVSPAAYVSSICSAVGPFERDVLARSSALDLTSAKSPAEGKQALQSFLSAVSADTDRAVAKLQAAGTPNVKNGQQISNAILGAFTQLKTAMHRAVAQANTLPTNNPTDFKNAAQRLGNNVRASMTSIGANLQSSTLKSPELQKAAANSAACKNLGNS